MFSGIPGGEALTKHFCYSDDKLKEQIKKKMRDNYNWPFENNYGKQDIRFEN